MRAYRFSIYALIAFAIAYPAIAGSVLVFGPSTGVDEIYPFAPWALFCFVPNEEIDFDIRFRSLNGRPLESPQFYDELLGLDQGKRTVGYAIIQRLGQFAVHGDDRQMQYERHQFEQNYLSPYFHAAEYEFVMRRYDVLERWQTGDCRQVETITRFDFHRGAAGS